MQRAALAWLLAGVMTVAGALNVTWADDANPKSEVAKPPPKVVVAEIGTQAVRDEREYTGTTAAVKGIELRAQVTGYLLERRFTEGSDVEAGETLYIIDPSPFQAVLEQKQAELRGQEAIFTYAKSEEKRYQRLARAGAASQERLEQAIELQSRTIASIALTKSEIAYAKIELGYTTITAPFAGRIGRTLVHTGDLVRANETALASLVQLDPIYVYFNPPETDLLAIEDEQAKAPLPVTITLPNAAAEPFTGTLSFIGNQADAETGTISMRAEIANPAQRLRPGQFALVRLSLGVNARALVVPAKAISSIQGQRYVMVVGRDNTLERRYIRLGRQVGTGSYVVEHGLHQGDLVVVTDTRTLKAGMIVTPEREARS